jgi:hypothetical protein
MPDYNSKILVNFFLNECHFDRNLCSNLRKQVLGLNAGNVDDITAY